MENNKNIGNSSPSYIVSLTGFLLMLIFLNPVIILKEFCSTFCGVCVPFLKLFLYMWGKRNKICTHRNVTQNLQLAKPEAAASAVDTCCNELRLEELKTVMEKLGTSYDPDAGKLQDRMGPMDITALFEEQEPSLQEVKEAFCIFDINNDGFIDAAELKKVIATLSSTTPSDSDSASMIGAYDYNGDGVIDFSEFLQLVTCSFS